MFKVKIKLRNVVAIAICLAVSMMMFSSCQKDDPNSPDDPIKSGEKQITGFSFASPAATGAIDQTAKTIAIELPFGTNVTALVPAITVSANATVSPASGVAQNFTTPVKYTVTAENGSKDDYTVTVTVKDNDANPNPDMRLVTYLYAYESSVGAGTYNYEYDSQNRLVKITATGGNAGVWNITYPSANTVRYDNANYRFVMTKNSQGYVTNYEATHNGTINVKQDLEYENGYLTKTTNDIGGITVINTYTWNTGNLGLVESRMPLLPIPMEKVTFSYTTTPNKQGYISPWTISHQDGNWMCPANWAGKMSPNLVSSKTQETLLGKSTFVYRYEMDSAGYVTKVYSKKDSEPEIPAYEVRYK